MNSSRFVCIDGFAEELDEIIYEGISNWFVSFRSVFTVYAAHFSYLVVFFVIICCGILSYRHCIFYLIVAWGLTHVAAVAAGKSVENGRKYTQFWWGALVHGVLTERGLTATKYWHAQAPVMFFGKQLPLHIVFFYPSVLYVSMMAVQRLKLNVCTEPAAVGLIAMLMEIPYRMISVKFLHITYHDSDPLYCNKICGVPWVEIFSSLVFASSYVAVYNATKFYYSHDLSTLWNSEKPNRKETLTTIMCGMSSPIFGFVQKLLFFHVFHDFLNVNPISCWFFLTSLYFSFVVCFEPKKIEKHVIEDTHCKTFLFYQVFIYLICLTYLALFGNPQNEISIGSHEPTGDCTMLICSRTPLGKPLKRKKYLCADEVASRKSFVFNFDCLEEGPPCLHAIWYTICGSTIYNRPQFFLNVLSFLILLCTFFTKTLFSDTTQLETAKRLILRFRSEFRRREQNDQQEQAQMPESAPTSTQEVTVGLVLVKDDVHFITKAER